MRDTAEFIKMNVITYAYIEISQCINNLLDFTLFEHYRHSEFHLRF